MKPSKLIAVCGRCAEERPLHARGLCEACYNRARKDGTLEEYESQTRDCATHRWLYDEDWRICERCGFNQPMLTHDLHTPNGLLTNGCWHTSKDGSHEYLQRKDYRHAEWFLAAVKHIQKHGTPKLWEGNGGTYTYYQLGRYAHWCNGSPPWRTFVINRVLSPRLAKPSPITRLYGKGFKP